MIRQRALERRWVPAVGALTLLTALSRLLFRSDVPVNWDAVQYILALDRFDIAAHQPHPPGNPLYVLLGRGAHLLLPDPNQALVALSILASVVAVLGTALIGERVAGRTVGFWAAALVAVNPLYWYYSEVALSYAPEAAVGILVALAAWHAYSRPGWHSAVLMGLAMALAGGVRPTVLPLLGPLWLFALVQLSWRDRAVAAGVTALGCLSWLVPLLELSGGPAAYWTQLQRLTHAAVEPTSLFNGPSMSWLRNLGALLAAIAVSLNVFGVLVGVAIWRRRPGLWPLAPRTIFLWLWMLPPLAMFSLVHFGQWGYLLLILPAMLLLGLIQLEGVWPTVSRPGGIRVATAVAASALLFLLVPAFAATETTFQPTAAALRVHDANWRTVREVTAALPPEKTLILASADGRQSFRLAGYLLPSYNVVGIGHDWNGNWGSLYLADRGWSTYQLDPNKRARDVVLVSDVEYLVILDQSLASRLPDASSWTHIALVDRNPLLVRAIAPGSAYVSFIGDEIRVLSSMAAATPDEPGVRSGS